jgi:eukaryotic-like serine/threonine-protein kinase
MTIPREVGNYQLERLLGRGGSSEVWLGRHRHLRERTAAVKVLMSHDADTVERFRQEASLTSRLRHPQIVQIYDHGLYAPFHCTIMEYLAGGSLRQLLDQQRSLPPDASLAIFKQVGAALDFAHQHGIIHRDVSPGNILLDAPFEGKAERVRALLTDFGIARQPGKQLTTVRTIMGTPDYFSPEHLQGATSVTPLSDIFGLGVVLYTMLSGHSPWPAVPDAAGFRWGPPLPLAEHGVKLPADLDRIFQIMLALNPAHRYQTVGTALEALEKVFVRHTSTTVMMTGKSATGASAAPPAPPVVTTNLQLEASGIALDEVERVLGTRLDRAAIERAQARAEALRQPAAVAALLDTWGSGGTLRQRGLGRLAVLRKVSSHNIYFYQLRVLYETREPPHIVEEPDLKAAKLPLEPERDEWQTPLPPPSDFVDEPGGEAVVKGSLRVVACDACTQGITVCTTCKGAGRVTVRRPAPTEPSASNAAANAEGGTATAVARTTMREVLEPCSTCSGRGGIRCGRCQGSARLLQRRAFHWRRHAAVLDESEVPPKLDQRWFERHCTPAPIYAERVVDGFHPDWGQVPGLADLVVEAQADTASDTRVVLSEVTISFVPTTDVVFGLDADENARLHGLTIYGFDNAIPSDWRFLNWDRAALIFGGGFCVLVAVLSVALLFALR